MDALMMRSHFATGSDVPLLQSVRTVNWDLFDPNGALKQPLLVWPVK
jgi:hypothetical protein